MNHHRRYGRLANSRTPIDVAWQICLDHPEIREDFRGQAKIYGWDHKFQQSPFWAYWFARNVVTDEWIPGEDLILQDDDIWKTYVTYTESLKVCDILGWTLRTDPDHLTDDFGTIRGFKPGRRPIALPSRVARPSPAPERFGTTEDAGDLADQIAARMEAFRKQRKLLDDSDED